MSTINTGPIDVNYPIPGVNNNTQGFRSNFTSIRNNLNIAATEISDLQNKAVLKSALTGTVLNNDMANALITNACVSGFRSTTYDLGSNLSGAVVIDTTNGDVQYGTITGNIQLQFSKWAPAGTQSNVEVVLSIANTAAVLNFPNNVTTGVLTIDNYQPTDAIVGGTVVLPVTATQVHYRFSTLDCGETVTVEPINLPRQSNQVVKRIVTSAIGRLGDVAGDVCIGAGSLVGAITVINGGSNYVGATVTISAPQVDGGTTATGTATIAAGVITQIVITNAGSGYLTAPTVTITATGTPLGSGAQAETALAPTDNYFYYCYNNYDGSTAIWNKLTNDTW